jgi:hypothetical protein
MKTFLLFWFVLFGKMMLDLQDSKKQFGQIDSLTFRRNMY